MDLDYRDLINDAVGQLMRHETASARALFKRAVELGAPSCLTNLKLATVNYMLLPMSANLPTGGGIEWYFKNLVNLRNAAQANYTFQEDYREALASLVNIKELFLRVAGIDYSTEILKSRTGFFVEEVFNLFSIIHNIYDDVVTRDLMGIRRYLPNTNMKEFALDLLEVKAFCLNLLLSYTTVESTNVSNNGYTATTIIDEPFATTTIRENISVHTSGTVCPRLHILRGKQARYREYKAIYDETVAKINRSRNFDCPKELRDEIWNKLQHKITNKTDKEYFRYIKKFEKDIKRWDFSFGLLFAAPVIGVKMLRKLLPIKINDVCSFEMETIFNRKILFGVCNMLANGKHWDLDIVRYVFCVLTLFMGLGAVLYAFLALAMHFEKYPPAVYVEKHC